MSRTLTLPPTDRRMWRRALGFVHPDKGGDHEVFIWLSSVREHVAGDRIEEKPYIPPPRKHEWRRESGPHDTHDRVPFFYLEDFYALSEKIASTASEVPEVYGRLLRELADCYPVESGPLYRQQYKGATYKQLGAIGHRAGMDKPQRVEWYRLCESLPLSQRHAGHLLSKLQEGAA